MFRTPTRSISASGDTRTSGATPVMHEIWNLQYLDNKKKTIVQAPVASEYVRAHKTITDPYPGTDVHSRQGPAMTHVHPPHPITAATGIQKVRRPPPRFSRKPTQPPSILLKSPYVAAQKKHTGHHPRRDFPGHRGFRGFPGRPTTGPAKITPIITSFGGFSGHRGSRGSLLGGLR